MDTPTLSDPFTAKTPGKLTIFASYFPGTGKSHAMLEAARTAKQEDRIRTGFGRLHQKAAAADCD